MHMAGYLSQLGSLIRNNDLNPIFFTFIHKHQCEDKEGEWESYSDNHTKEIRTFSVSVFIINVVPFTGSSLKELRRCSNML